jgi:hypothetical protein
VWQIPDAVDAVVCTPDDGWWYHPKHVEQFPDKLNCVKLHVVGYILEYITLVSSLIKIRSVTIEKFHIRRFLENITASTQTTWGYKTLNTYLECPLFLTDFNQNFASKNLVKLYGIKISWNSFLACIELNVPVLWDGMSCPLVMRDRLRQKVKPSPPGSSSLREVFLSCCSRNRQKGWNEVTKLTGTILETFSFPPRHWLSLHWIKPTSNQLDRISYFPFTGKTFTE